MASKVVELNLESGMPSAENAVRNMKNALATYKGQGTKAVIIIHGYGSSGVGGSIKTAVARALGESSLRGIVKAYCGGEQWINRKKELVTACGSLADYDRRISGNEGITVVVLK